jgi:sugar O-acyltransferase (sialic acid O-acetyltransferase NeuD family)
MVEVVIFGVKDLAQLAHYYISNDTQYEVAAFTVHEEFMPENREFGYPNQELLPDPLARYPIVPFERVEEIYPPSKYKFFAPMTGSRMNKNREAVYLEGKEKGYEYISYVSSKATVCDNKIGENCFIFEDNTLQPYTSIGNNVVLWSGNHLGHHSIIKDHVFFTSHVVLSGHCVVESYSWFGVNATIRDGLTIAEGSLIAMGALLTKNTKPWSTYMGMPAKDIGKNSLEANP